MSSASQDDNQQLLRELIAASDRTTHAVRAIVLPSTIMLVAILVALPFFLIFLVIQVVGFAIFAGLLIFVGAVLAISSQISETRLSNTVNGRKAETVAMPTEAGSPSPARGSQSPTTPSASEPIVRVSETESCECSILERGLGGVETKAGRKVCRRCRKPL